MLPEWRVLWADVYFSVSAVAAHAGLAADNVIRIVEGRQGGKNAQMMTLEKLRRALRELRDVCPECKRAGYKKAKAKR